MLSVLEGLVRDFTQTVCMVLVAYKTTATT